MTKRKPKGYWTYERCKAAAKKCKSRSEFWRKYISAYSKSIKNGWLNEICSHMERPSTIKYTKEIIIKEALKYKTRYEFKKKNNPIYEAAQRNNFLNESCKHMIYLGNRFIRCVYAYEFSDNHVYVGLTHDVNERYISHISQGPVKEHMDKTGLTFVIKQLTKYIPIEQAQEKEGYWQRKYMREGWIALHKAKPGGIGGSLIKWTKNNCIVVSLKCKTRTEFQNKFPGAYRSSVRNKWLKDVTIHLPNNSYLNNGQIKIISIKNNKKIKFNSLKEGSIKLKLNSSLISKVLVKERNHTGGYKFKYA